MGILIVICEACARARATVTVKFPDGETVQVCGQCHMTGGPE